MTHNNEAGKIIKEYSSQNVNSKIELTKISVLNHGFVHVVDYMGTDATISNTARCSTQSESKNDTGLIDYLMRHKHGSPFEFCEIVFHIKAPIFVFRHILRHRTANVNEKSLRYTEANESDFFIPETNQVRKQSDLNRQMTIDSLDKNKCENFQDDINIANQNCLNWYQKFLNDRVCREQARTILPVGIYSECYFKMDLRNLFNFFKLRIDKHAQYETRVFAQAMYDVVKMLFPIACASFEEHELYSITFSKTEIIALKELIEKFNNITVSKELYKNNLINYGVTGGRLIECLDKFDELQNV